MPLNVAFLWHLHQPYYVDPGKGRFLLPWVRLHAAKNYLFLAQIFSKYPELKQNVNFVPSLLKQIELYLEGNLEDLCLTISRKSAFDLSHEEKIFILENFFSANRENMIEIYPRYGEIYGRWMDSGCDPEKAMDSIGLAELTDLQLLFNLAWTNPYLYREREEIKGLVLKERNYNEGDKERLFSFHAEIMSKITPAYRELASLGHVELTLSPFYHPILPLLVDSDCAFEANPSMSPPDLKISLPEDAKNQILLGNDYFKDLFGIVPDGLWPPEGAISEDSIVMMGSSGFKYSFSDELVLQRSIHEKFLRDEEGIPEMPEKLYRPYMHGRSGIQIFFRDHFLSDLIGFVYKKWDPQKAASDLVEKLHRIRDKLVDRGFSPGDHIVSIIFDGENPWEHYGNYGIDFLERLFSALKESGGLNVTTFGDYLNRGNSEKYPVLQHVRPGSWIDGTFGIWFGHEEDFRAWEQIKSLHNSLYNNKIECIHSKKLYDHILCAEGSDWFWWYGDEHFTAHLKDFDLLFRNNLKMAYQEAGLTPPKELESELFAKERVLFGPTGEGVELRPKSYITPSIDGIMTDYYEWVGSAQYLQTPTFGSMHRSGHGIIKAVSAGYDKKYFFLRVDMGEEIIVDEIPVELILEINGNFVQFSHPRFSDKGVIKYSKDSKIWIDAVWDRIFEASFKIKDLIPKGKGEILFYIIGKTRGVFEERWPEDGKFKVLITGADPEKEEWVV